MIYDKNGKIIKSERFVIVELEKEASPINSTKEYYNSDGVKVSKPGAGDNKYVYACDNGWLFGVTAYPTKKDAINAAIHSSRKNIQSTFNYNVNNINSSKTPKQLTDGDMADATELYLYAENTAEIYHRCIKPTIKNLQRKIAAGTYDEIKALKAWENVIDEAAKMYDKEFGSGKGSLTLFAKPTRTEAAKMLMESMTPDFLEINKSITSSKEEKSETEGVHMKFKKLGTTEEAKLRDKIENALADKLDEENVRFAWDVFDDTVEFILSMFKEDSVYAPKTVKAAIDDWWNDTKKNFPDMIGKDKKKQKIASAAYLRRLHSMMI